MVSTVHVCAHGLRHPACSSSAALFQLAGPSAAVLQASLAALSQACSGCIINLTTVNTEMAQNDSPLGVDGIEMHFFFFHFLALFCRLISAVFCGYET